MFKKIISWIHRNFKRRTLTEYQRKRYLCLAGMLFIAAVMLLLIYYGVLK